jgi:hypothetical protein
MRRLQLIPVFDGRRGRGGRMNDRVVQELLDRERIGDVVNTLFIGTDARDWNRVRSCFAPVVSFDMTSLAGGAVQELSPEQITAGWEAGLRPIEHVHHQIGNLSVRCAGGEADASCYGIAFHYRRTQSGRNTRTFVGSYDLHFVPEGETWLIRSFTFRLKFMDGNLELEREP